MDSIEMRLSRLEALAKSLLDAMLDASNNPIIGGMIPPSMREEVKELRELFDIEYA